MRRWIATLLLVVTVSGVSAVARAQTTQPASSSPSPSPSEGWKPLFNGKDLTGFYTFLKGPGKDSDPDKVFQVHDGLVHIYKDAADGAEVPFGYFCTDQELGDCRIRFQYKWGTKRFGTRAKSVRDSGCLYFVTGPDGGQGGTWPASVECQIQENDVGDIYAIGTTVTTTVDPATLKSKQTFKDASEGGVPFTNPDKGFFRIIRNPMAEVPDWNTVEIVLDGESAPHIVNGKTNMKITRATLRKPDSPPLTKGKVLFQAEGAEVFYRNIEIQPLRKP